MFLSVHILSVYEPAMGKMSLLTELCHPNIFLSLSYDKRDWLIKKINKMNSMGPHMCILKDIYYLCSQIQN